MPRYAISTIMNATHMELTNEDISAFQQLYFLHTGRTLTTEEAREMALEVIAYVRLVRRLDLRTDLTGQ